jgi:hypothetical protein
LKTITTISYTLWKRLYLSPEIITISSWRKAFGGYLLSLDYSQDWLFISITFATEVIRVIDKDRVRSQLVQHRSLITIGRILAVEQSPVYQEIYRRNHEIGSTLSKSIRIESVKSIVANRRIISIVSSKRQGNFYGHHRHNGRGFTRYVVPDKKRFNHVNWPKRNGWV